MNLINNFITFLLDNGHSKDEICTLFEDDKYKILILLNEDKDNNEKIIIKKKYKRSEALIRAQKKYYIKHKK